MALRTAVVFLLAACVGCVGPRPVQRSPAAQATFTAAGDTAAVLAAVERLFAGMRERDEAMLRRAIHPRALIYSRRADDDAGTFRTAEEFIAVVLASSVPLHERMDDPVVQIEDGIASVWGYYELWRGDTFSHCGSDAFHLIRDGGEWRLIAVTYTLRQTGCNAS